MPKRDMATVCAWAALETPLSTAPLSTGFSSAFGPSEDTQMTGPLAYIVNQAHGFDAEHDGVAQESQGRWLFFRSLWRPSDSAQEKYANYVVGNPDEFAMNQFLTAKMYLVSRNVDRLTKQVAVDECGSGIPDRTPADRDRIYESGMPYATCPGRLHVRVLS